MVDNRVKKVTASRAVNRGDGYRLVLKSKLVEFIKLKGGLANLVALVDAGNDRLSALLEHCGDIAVVGGKSRAHVAHENNNVGGVDCKLSLKTHLLKNDVVGLGLYSSGVDYYQPSARPLAFAVDPVAGNAGGVFHDRASLSYKFVKQCAFTHVGSAHYSYNWFCHFVFSFLV